MFGHKLIFHDYLSQYSAKHFRRALLDLFDVLNTPIDKRDPYLDDDLAKFPYVNGGMFAETDMEVPNFTDELRELILENASSGFDWSSISPTIFGAVFESTLNPETRRSGGMHYTSIENIHKVIDPLFLDELKNELNEIRQYKLITTVEQKAKQFQLKLAKLTFFDPACGSGNFLTETYLSLRRLENEAIKLYMGDTVSLDLGQDLVKVKLSQFYGVEINDFAVSVAKTALWIAESQMLEDTKEIIFTNIDFLPLKSYTNIVEGNALILDWEEIIPKHNLNYIIGNPPFIGHKNVSPEQKLLMKKVFNNKQGRLDFVSAWYKIASDYIDGTTVECCFVSTNSVVQGVHIERLWKPLIEKGIHINFAYKSFVWGSEAKEQAAVHCVILGFSLIDKKEKFLFETPNKDKFSLMEKTSYISPYLTTEKRTIITSRKDPICDVPRMIYGNIPRDGGFYTFTSTEKIQFLIEQPEAKPYMYKLIGGKEFINNIERWVLFLRDCPINELRRMPKVLERVESVKQFRLSSKAKEIQKFSETPTKFAQLTQPIGKDYIAVPIVSSEKRKYVPIGFVNGNILTNNQIQIIPETNLFHFGILTSNVHNAFMRSVAGRLEMRYRYSKDIVYNNFPWPEVDNSQMKKIELTAQSILDARGLYPNLSLADMYDDLVMPVELRKAHQENDKAVMEAYGMVKFVDGKKTWLTESETVGKLFEMYEELNRK
nr:DNA methyltransferase [Streptococcus iniae]